MGGEIEAQMVANASLTAIGLSVRQTDLNAYLQSYFIPAPEQIKRSQAWEEDSVRQEWQRIDQPEE